MTAESTITADGSAKPRLWIVSELYFPEQTSTGYFLTRIAEGLASTFDVGVLSGRPSYSERSTVVGSRETRHGVGIRRLASTRFSKDRLIGRAVNVVSFTASLAVAGIRFVRRDDRILVVTNPPTAPIVMLMVARLKGARVVQLVHDVYPDILDATDILPRNHSAFKLLDAFFAWIARRFDRVVVLGRDMEQLYRARMRDRAERVCIIPNWADLDEISPLPRTANPFRVAHGLAERLTIQFSGNIGRTHDVESLLQVAKDRRCADDLTIMFVGAGGKSSMIAHEFDQAQRSNIVFLPRQPREDLRAMLTSADATVIGFVDKMFGLSVPSRMYNVMAAGVPIIAIGHPQSELSRVVTEAHCGWVVAPGDTDGLGAIIDRLRTPIGFTEAAIMGANGRRHAEEHYAFETIIGRFRRLLSSI